jgi:hypothetical protein
LVVRFENLVNYIQAETNTVLTSNNDVKTFPQLLEIYLHDFQVWKVSDTVALKGKITSALTSLYRVAQFTDHPQINAVNSSIEKLRSKMVLHFGQAELDSYDNQRSLIPATVQLPFAEAPYITNQQLLQLTSRINRGSIFSYPNADRVSNEQLAHEILINPSFQLDDNGSISGRAKCINSSFIDTFWSDLLNELTRPEPCFACSLGVLGYLLDGLNDILDSSHDSHVGLRLEAETILNINHIKDSNVLSDWSSCKDLFDKIFDFIIRVQVQKREEESIVKWNVLKSAMQEAQADEQALAIYATLKFFGDHIKLMRVDAANMRISSIVPLIKESGVKYEQEKFHLQLDQGTLTLDNTTEWLYNEIDEIKVRELRELVNGNAETLRTVHITALVNLIINPAIDKTQVDKIPEVLRLDLHRLEYISEQYPKLVNCATVMRVISDFASQGSERDELSEALLESISNMVLAHDPKNFEDIKPLFDSIMQTSLKNLVSAEDMVEMQNEMEKTFVDPFFDKRTTV